MINVTICDDDKVVRDFIRSTLEYISIQHCLSINIKEFESGEKFIDSYKKHDNHSNIIFLDIILESISGIEIAKIINEFNNGTQIILTSYSKDYILDGYEVGALNYLLKPLSKDAIIKEFMRALDNLYNTNTKLFKINQGSKLIAIPLVDINYFEAFNRKVIVHLDNESIEFYGKFDDVNKRVCDYGFSKCHRSYIVNISKITELSSSEITLLNDIKIPVSRKFVRKIENLFFDFIHIL